MANIDMELERLIEEYGNDVLKIAYLYLKSKDKAEDVFQEVFLKVYSNYDKLNNIKSEKSWIVSITINTCKDMLKSSWLKRIIFLGEKEEECSFICEEDVEKKVLDKIYRKGVLKKIMDLPDKYKEPILLYYYEEFSTGEISEILKVPEGTIRSRLHRGRQLLKNIIGGKS
ncbi:RNA polymerase sigma-70 factor (ECF subfamily) [Clostridium tetanomorphum]|nr:sigma-70 family RNA polymerase sigma factor [Clostridium tetanomorphum]KAJ49275.1 RNA polymerase sigma factor [Clostridium tetanomorphum DSM 665]KAJ53935.1 RNA polymerase sigma factor [Clostridium tetanomorphum DSM 665]MBP1864648.1 RNA polymerase sigma-70 factor (ECF subfamily) [Clostridium tetanomorphum]NRS84118.1 RNA polymerase sigma-70 factor (ECF subfamily) [Clostridium tetanomorphum]NRZ97331.1 RNA polymerase sigma-70 factor (ECF subfamily) [Clostridium tetanomorphum]